MALRSAIHFIRHLLRDEDGNALALTALVMPLLIGCAGLAVDTIQWVSLKRDLQGATDAAAVAGVYGLIKTGNMEEAVDRSIASMSQLGRQRAVSAEQSPEGYSDDPFAVRVRVTTVGRLFFTSLFR